MREAGLEEEKRAGGRRGDGYERCGEGGKGKSNKVSTCGKGVSV